MQIIHVAVERTVYRSQKPFDYVLSSLDDGIGHPPFQQFMQNCYDAPDEAALEKTVAGVVGKADILQFFRLDMGRVLMKYPHQVPPRSIRLIAGNPAIMAHMAVHDPEAASYAPVTILIDQRKDGVYVSYDRMASLLQPYGNNEALNIARQLDDKVETLIREAVGE